MGPLAVSVAFALVVGLGLMLVMRRGRRAPVVQWARSDRNAHDALSAGAGRGMAAVVELKDGRRFEARWVGMEKRADGTTFLIFERPGGKMDKVRAADVREVRNMRHLMR